MSESKKNLIGNIRPKLITSIVIFILVVTGARYAGFPPAWVIQFGIFVIAGFLFFILLDLPPMHDQSKGSGVMKNLLVTFVFMTLPYPAITAGLPQFDYHPIEFHIIRYKPSYADYIYGGKEVFTTYKCLTCHKIWKDGSSDIGPDLGINQIGLYSPEYIKEQIIDHRSIESPGFENIYKKQGALGKYEKNLDYYKDDISEGEMKVLLIYLGTLKGDNNSKADKQQNKM